MKKELIINELKLRAFGAKGWLAGDNLACPNPACGKKGKFGINLTKPPGAVHCFFCDYSSSLYQYLKHLGRLDLWSGEVSAPVTSKIEGLVREIEDSVNSSNCELPLFFTQVKSDPYLDSRGFTDVHYNLFQPGVSPARKGYLIFKIFEQGVLKGWLARSKREKGWHKKNLEDFKNGEAELQLRYENSKTDFNSLIGGFDDITPRTEFLIVVEGLFDKVGVDTKLGLHSGEETRCIFTFGDKFSDEQLEKIKSNFPNIKTVVILYDFSTVGESKRSALRAMNYFQTWVGEIKSNNDPGSIPKEELEKVVLNIVDPVQYFSGRLEFW